jgi:ferric-dicitrate binding protein FerR (iron transport regulator)
VPRGGQFQITLSDGTEVWLNSESQLKYPVTFTDGETRKVELVYGEGYFDVSPSTNHSGASFSVYNKSQEVKVLGTEFNIKAYKDEATIYTTLVEGKVAVTANNNNIILTPNQQSSVNLNNNTLTVNTVDIYDETSWKEGVFSFNKKSLKEIMQVLSRWYDMDVTFENKKIENIGFNGALGKEQNIEEILETIKSFGIVKNYEINNKSIIIK